MLEAARLPAGGTRLILAGMNRSIVPLVTTSVIAGFALAAAYIHWYVGGILLLLNAAGAVGLLAVVLLTSFVARRARPLALTALTAYTTGSIGGWLVMGPYFDLAYMTKGIELALIGVIALELWRTRADLRPAFAWLLSRMPVPQRVAGK